MTEVWRLLLIQRHKLRFAKLEPVLLFFIFVTLKPVGEGVHESSDGNTYILHQNVWKILGTNTLEEVVITASSLQEDKRSIFEFSAPTKPEIPQSSTWGEYVDAWYGGLNSFISNSTLGLVPVPEPRSVSEKQGQQVGDFLSLLAGVLETWGGSAGTSGGVALAPATGGTSLVVAGGSSIVTGHGIGMTTLASARLLMGKWDNYEGEAGEEQMGNYKGGKSSKESMPEQVAKKVGINPKEFTNYLHKIKTKERMTGKDSFSWDELVEIAEDFKNNK